MNTSFSILAVSLFLCRGGWMQPIRACTGQNTHISALWQPGLSIYNISPNSINKTFDTIWCNSFKKQTAWKHMAVKPSVPRWKKYETVFWQMLPWYKTFPLLTIPFRSWTHCLPRSLIVKFSTTASLRRGPCCEIDICFYLRGFTLRPPSLRDSMRKLPQIVVCCNV